jgi:AAA domain
MSQLQEYGFVGDPDEALPTHEQIEAALPATNGHASKLQLIKACDFMAEELPEPPQVIHGILHQGSKFCIGGASKACKTWALLDLALSVSNGVKWIDFETCKGKVLYINFEIQNFAWQRRISTVCKSRQLEDLTNITLLNLRGQPSEFSLLIPRLIESIQKEGFLLVIIDPIYKLYGRTDENNARDVAALLTAIERLTSESGAAVAYASHFSKGNQAGKEPQDRVSGSGVFARDPDSLLMFTKHAEEDAFTVESILRNFPPVDPFVVRWNFPLLSTDESLNPEDLKKPGGRPATYYGSDAIELLTENSLTTTEWCQNCHNELGMSERSFYRLIKELEKDGKVLKSKANGKWTPINSK